MTNLREPSERVSPRARTMWTLGALGNSVFTLGVLALVAYVWAPFDVPWWAFALLTVAFGLALGLMNWSIYQSFARIPIGLAVTFEFIGPLTLAVLGSRRPRDLVWVGLAGLGVLLLGVQPADLNWAGVGFALLAAATWAAYILLSAHTGRRWEGLDGLAVASLVATSLLTPLTLGRYADLTRAGDPLFNELTVLAARLCGTPMALLAFVDERHCWIRAALGLDIGREPRERALCDGTVRAGLPKPRVRLTLWPRRLSSRTL